MILLRFITLISLIWIAACNSASPEFRGLTEKDKAALNLLAESDARWVLGKRWDTLTALYTDDAVRLPPNEPAIRGKNSIRLWYDKLPPIKDFTFQTVDLRGDGNFAFMHSAFTLTVAPPDMPEIRDTGKILIVFKKQSNGSWLRVADAFNSNLPPGK
jgi:ketosteroid isomerase-like protein